jgi:hypothetical protein
MGLRLVLNFFFTSKIEKLYQTLTCHPRVAPSLLRCECFLDANVVLTFLNLFCSCCSWNSTILKSFKNIWKIFDESLREAYRSLLLLTISLHTGYFRMEVFKKEF